MPVKGTQIGVKLDKAAVVIALVDAPRFPLVDAGDGLPPFRGRLPDYHKGRRAIGRLVAVALARFQALEFASGAGVKHGAALAGHVIGDHAMEAFAKGDFRYGTHSVVLRC